MSYLKTLDLALLKFLYQRPFQASSAIKTLIFIGDGPFWMLLIFASALLGQLLHLVVFEQLAVLLMLALALGNALFTPMKIKIKRRRPYANPELQQKLQLEILNRDPGHGSKALESFPSGHAFWTTLSVLVIVFQLGWPAAVALLWLIPVMIFMRPYLGVHYPSDTLVGFALGCVIAAVVAWLKADVWNVIGQIKLWAGAVYFYGYWFFILGYIFVGFKSWLKRV